jgi:hypothetical protein
MEKVLLTIEENLVSISPGAKQLTLMFSEARSSEAAFVSPRRAVLLTAYAPNTEFGCRPAIDEMKTILPPPRSLKNGSTSLANRNEAFTFTSNILSQAFSLVSSTGPVSGVT